MRIDREYFAILAASTAAMNSLSVLEVATVGWLKLRLERDSTVCETKGWTSHRSTTAQVGGVRRVDVTHKLQEV
jgi:hypothetical protein